mmetsp:Transcript_3976/g.8908  ORF Transcript_3976/g.8908 Transcript_3976/m.8908 type:complete len:267 (+) Transcript_3976:40-840(+)
MADRLILDFDDALVHASDLALLDSDVAWLNDACINFQMTRLQHRASAKGAKKRPRESEGGDGSCHRPPGDDDLFLDPSVVSFLMHQLPPDDEDYDHEIANLNRGWNLPRSQSKDRRRIFIPVSDQFGASRSAFSRPGGGNHWSMLLWEVSREEVSFGHFDSSSGLNREAAVAVARKVVDVLRVSNSDHDGCRVRVVERKTPQQGNGHDCGVFALGVAEILAAMPFGMEKAEEELQKQYDERGGQGEFAIRLRRRIGDDIRRLAASK